MSSRQAFAEVAHLVPGNVHPAHDDQEREYELEESVGRGQPHLGVDVDGVEIGAVDHPQPGPGEEEDEEPVVEVSDTVASEHTVVFPLEDAEVAGRAVPGPGWGDGLTDGAVVPVFPAHPVAGDDDVPGAGVHQPADNTVYTTVAQLRLRYHNPRKLPVMLTTKT